MHLTIWDVLNVSRIVACVTFTISSVSRILSGDPGPSWPPAGLRCSLISRCLGLCRELAGAPVGRHVASPVPFRVRTPPPPAPVRALGWRLSCCVGCGSRCARLVEHSPWHVAHRRQSQAGLGLPAGLVLSPGAGTPENATSSSPESPPQGAGGPLGSPAPACPQARPSVREADAAVSGSPACRRRRLCAEGLGRGARQAGVKGMGTGCWGGWSWGAARVGEPQNGARRQKGAGPLCS